MNACGRLVSDVGGIWHESVVRGREMHINYSNIRDSKYIRRWRDSFYMKNLGRYDIAVEFVI